MKTWKIICIVSLAANVLVLSLWLSGHLRYQRYSTSNPIHTARLVHGDPMETLPDYSRRMAGRIVRSYDDYVRSRVGGQTTIDEAYRTFFADALAGYYDEDWDIWQLVADSAYVDGVARILFREPYDLFPIVSLSYTSPTLLSAPAGYYDGDDELRLYSGWHLRLNSNPDNIFFRSLMANNRQWAGLVEASLVGGGFMPPGFLQTLREQPDHFNFSDQATRLYISLVFLDRYIQYNPAFRQVI